MPTVYRIYITIAMFSSQQTGQLIGFAILLLLLKMVGSARLRESDIQPISTKTPPPQYQPIDRKMRKGKRAEDYSKDRAALANKKHWLYS